MGEDGTTRMRGVTSAPRWIELAGAHNVRDLGDLGAGEVRTRRGVLVRGDNLDELTSDDIRRLTVEYRLRAVVDLRNVAECPSPPGWLAAARITHRHIPLFDLSGETAAVFGEHLRRDVGAAYRRMLDMAGPAISEVLKLIIGGTERVGPVLVHCAAGKDRTGIVVAVLLRAIGLPEEVIVADYMATAERIAAVRTALAQREMYRPVPTDGPMPTMTTEPIRSVLSALGDEPGGAAGYLARWGATPEQVGRLRTVMLLPR